MKFQSILFPALILFGSILFFASCEKEKELPVQPDQPELDTSSAEAVDDAMMLEMSQRFAAYKAQLAKLPASDRSSCPQTIVVPDDYPTIQEAIDAACHEDGTEIIVNEGTYEEGRVFITKPNLHLKANGAVTLVGGFSLDGNADNTHIHKFNIFINDEAESESYAPSGIYGIDFTGGDFKQNTISSAGENESYGTDLGIWLGNVSNVTIKQNTVFNLDWGIVIIAGYTGTGSPVISEYNTIQDNTVYNILRSSGIGLQGNCDNNTIKGNTVYDKSGFYNAGIFFNYNYPDGFPDNNTVKSNTVTNCTQNPGIWIYGSNNTIGPNNVANSNNLWGIYIWDTGGNNHIFNNTALNNVPCDIHYGDPSNTYSNNTADCDDL